VGESIIRTLSTEGKDRKIMETIAEINQILRAIIPFLIVTVGIVAIVVEVLRFRFQRRVERSFSVFLKKYGISEETEKQEPGEASKASEVICPIALRGDCEIIGDHCDHWNFHESRGKCSGRNFPCQEDCVPYDPMNEDHRRKKEAHHG